MPISKFHRKEGNPVATESFDKTFVIRDEKTAESIRSQLLIERETINKPSKDFLEERERGRRLLERL